MPWRSKTPSHGRCPGQPFTTGCPTTTTPPVRLPAPCCPTKRGPSRTPGATTSASWASRRRREPLWGSFWRIRGSRMPSRGHYLGRKKPGRCPLASSCPTRRMSRRRRRRRPQRPRTTPGSGGTPTWSVAALCSPGPSILGPRPAPRRVSRLGQPPSPRWGRFSTSWALTGPEGAMGRRAHGVPRVLARGPTAEPRRPQRPTPTGTVIRRPVMTGPGRRPTVTGPRNGMTTTPTWPVPKSVTGSRPMPAAAPEAPAKTPGTLWTEDWAALPARGMPARGWRPVRATVAAVLPPASTAP